MKKKFICSVLAAIYFIVMAPLGATCALAETEEEIEMPVEESVPLDLTDTLDWITDVTLSGEDGTALGEDTPPGAGCLLTYTFAVPDGAGIHAGDTAAIALPGEISTDRGESFQISDDGGAQIAAGAYDGQNIIVTFNGDMTSQAAGTFSLCLNFNEANISGENPVNIVFPLSCGHTKTIGVNFAKAQAPAAMEIKPLGTIAVEYGDTLDLSKIGANEHIVVEQDAVATITDSNSAIAKHNTIACEDGVELTLENVNIDVSGTEKASPLSFTDYAKLTLVGDNVLKAGKNRPGVKAVDDTMLIINGKGKLNAIGGMCSAGIGGGNGNVGGMICIEGGIIEATGGAGGAGIGGGLGGAGCDMEISGGTVTATGGNNGAGIGGGQDGAGSPADGSLEITGGIVTATGGDNGAGIGGGENGDGGEIYVENSNVTAIGGNSAAGIGGGKRGAGGTIGIESGKIEATGGSFGGAGIGGGYDGDGGIITISGGKVQATGGDCSGAGIGGGEREAGGIITISGGKVTVTGGDNGAGIGGGLGGEGGDITILGGTVTATGGNSGAGIGGGLTGAGGDIRIENGTVTAKGGNSAAGIGGGEREAGGMITATGGLIYAVKGGNAPHDIGNGYSSIMGTCSFVVSGGAAVFLKNNVCIPPTVETGYAHKTKNDTENPMIFKNNMVYGLTVPASWTGVEGGYFQLYTLDYDANGCNGSVPDSVTQAKGTKTIIADKGDLSRAGYDFTGWNTMEDGSGTDYAAGDTLTYAADITLYAQWRTQIKMDISRPDDESIGLAGGTIYTGGRITLTPHIEGGNWIYDEDYLYRAGNTFKGLKSGRTQVTYTVGWTSGTVDITIIEASLPNTGQDFTWVYLLMAAAAAVGVAAFCIKACRKKAL